MTTYSTYWPGDYDYTPLGNTNLEWSVRGLPFDVIKEARQRLLREKEKLAHYDEIDQQEEDGGNV